MHGIATYLHQAASLSATHIRQVASKENLTFA